MLDEDGTLLMEMGYGQAERVAALADETERLALVRTRRDLQGIPRVAVHPPLPVNSPDVLPVLQDHRR